MQQLNQLSAGAQCLVCSDHKISFYIVLISRKWSQSPQSFCSRTGALPNRPTKELRRLLALFLQILKLILYKLFGSIFTIKYILRSKNLSKCRVYSFLRDLWATWPISKSETPQGFQGTLSKTQYLRRTFYVSFMRFLVVPLVHHICSPAVYMFLFLYLNSSCIPFIQKRQPVDPIAFIWCHHTLSYPSICDCYLLI